MLPCCCRCGPCKLILPQLVELSAELEPKATIVKFNCNQHNKELAKALGIKVAPTFHLYRNGTKVADMTGNGQLGSVWCSGHTGGIPSSKAAAKGGRLVSGVVCPRRRAACEVPASASECCLPASLPARLARRSPSRRLLTPITPLCRGFLCVCLHQVPRLTSCAPSSTTTCSQTTKQPGTACSAGQHGAPAYRASVGAAHMPAHCTENCVRGCMTGALAFTKNITECC